MKLNRLLLDELVQGLELDPKAWELLLKNNGREALWDEAVKRREQLDRFCSFAASWPNLAQKYKQVQALVKKNVASPKVKLFEGSYPVNPLQASLKNSGAESEYLSQLSIDVIWGEQQIIVLEGTKQVRFDVDTKLVIHYLYLNYEGVITTDDSWDFQPSEGPVILTFIDGNDTNKDISIMAQKAKSLATIVLLPK
ncbi:hypothetical protein BM527_13815 [Alteromonas sp. Mex14]|nr:hypothetical protein BM527_13815 [Alteromonas sp. Mex14]